ncbi:uncharacterized protein RJT20DRAFT_63702 [Scheffersomyces xylosifermentans]|uniref:uncharacterized protein n=1 Tax=Scheffersomyces xylosifermentans TaxID=1304137 RepID=UPI00315D8CBD
MSAFRPYGSHETRIVSDLSRFDYESISARNRSRNPTPTSEDHSSVLTLDTIIPLYSSRLDKNLYSSDKTLLEIAEASQSLPKTRPPPVPQKDAKQLQSIDNEFTPYPKSFNDKMDNNLPPVMDTNTFVKGRKVSQDSVSELQSLNSKQKQLEEDLVKRVMNRPLLTVPGKVLGPRYEDKQYTISTNFLVYLIEVIFAIIVITLSSILLGSDKNVGKGIYRYFIGDGIVSLIVSLLFISTAINFEKRNGSFYCLAATIMKVVSFIIVVSYILPRHNCESKSVCDTRKAVSSFIIISAFIWFSNLVVFLTTLYISRLNLLNDINFDFSNRGLNQDFNKSSDTLHESKLLNSETGEPLKEYYLTETGEMYELTDQWQRDKHRGKNKIIVYTF